MSMMRSMSGMWLLRLSGPLRPRQICMKPRAQRLRWEIYSLSPSGAKPSESGSGYEPWALQVLEVAGGRIVEFTFFLATDNAHGTELYKTDGSVKGTRLVKDINHGPASSHIQDASRHERSCDSSGWPSLR